MAAKKLARFQMILAHDAKGGIGKGNRLPWKMPEDLQFFFDTVRSHCVIYGRKTWESMRKRMIPGCRNIILTNDKSVTLEEGSPHKVLPSITQALIEAESNRQREDELVFICGGSSVYEECASRFSFLCDSVIATELHEEHDCDTFVKYQIWKDKCVAQEVVLPADLPYRRFRYTFHRKEDVTAPEESYLHLLREVLEKGEHRGDRTGTGTISMFGLRMEFDLAKGFPVMTTKKILVDKVIGELLWFVSGSTSVADLHKRNIHFWDANGSREFLDKTGLHSYEEGDLGPVYGFQWRHWGAEYISHTTDYTGQGVDQLAEIVRLIKEDPNSRRILLSAWNVADLKKMALPPCHVMVQFSVRNKMYLDCQLYQRSGDLFLGVPFNITSYCTLVHMLAHVTGILPGRFVHVIGDAHIYQNHVDAVNTQLRQAPRPFPRLSIRRTVSSIDDFTEDDFLVEDYQPAPFIKAPMAV